MPGWLAFGLFLAILSGCAREQPSAQARRGKELFTGAVPLEARMVGHTSELPADVVRCQNCHTARAAAPREAAAPAASALPADTLGPLLSRGSLTERRKRRGGPPSAYSRDAFCRLLRDGIDPAYVMIPSTMPRYVLSSDDCAALWEYLTSP